VIILMMLIYVTTMLIILNAIFKTDPRATWCPRAPCCWPLVYLLLSVVNSLPFFFCTPLLSKNTGKLN